MFRKAIGQIVTADWNEQTKKLEFMIEFHGSGYRLAGSLPSGFDPGTQTFITGEALKRKAREMIGMKVYDDTGVTDNGPITAERLTKLKLKISLSSGGISVVDKAPPRDSNAFLNRMLR